MTSYATRNLSQPVRTDYFVAGITVLVSVAMTALCVQSMFYEWDIAQTVMSRSMWESIATGWGATPLELQQGRFDLSYSRVFQVVFFVAMTGLLLGAVWIAASRTQPFVAVFTRWISRGWLWWIIPGCWEVLRIFTASLGWNSAFGLLLLTLSMWFVVAASGWIATLLSLTRHANPIIEPEQKSRRVLLFVLSISALYVLVFTWMNWQLYWGLQVPHGDSAMYEEHLWNLSHGKGFRSYLDDGRLFLGEHVQVIHLGLLPLHWLWPSQLMLELCESLALASAAIPVFFLARRQTGSAKQAACLAGAFLLFFPLHFLDIAIDGKTFRPISFGVPLMLFGIDQMERKRYRSMMALFFLAIISKEDYAVIVCLLGLWMAASNWRASKNDSSKKQTRWVGIGLAIFGAVYLFAVMKYIIPAFRDGDPHYFRYFGELGSSPGDVLKQLISRPDIVLGKLFSGRSLMYALFLLFPMGFLPLFSLGRLAVAAPLFGVLCLLELTAVPETQGLQVLVPFHHFHAPLIPILFWSAAAGLGWLNHRPLNEKQKLSPVFAVTFAICCALFSGALFGFSPLSVGFWDSGSDRYWQIHFVPGERAEKFAEVQKLIPKDARVFSTDFVHTRFTHHHRSYDYSDFRRKSDEERETPIAGETYYIVIDVRARYSNVQSAEDVREYREHPEDWELVSHNAEKYFIVLKRK